MTLRARHLGMALLGVPAIAAAEVPDVAVDIPPVHSLVDRVMGELGSPDLVIQPGASPHGYSMRPSEASALERAEVVFWVGDELAPWLGESIDSLAADAHSVSLLDVEGTRTLDFRQGATFEAHDHAHEGHDHDHAHEGHEHDHDHEGHDHDHAHEGHDHDHAHEGHDHDHAHESHGHDHADEGHEHDHAHEGHDHHGHGHSHDGTDPHAWLDPANAQVWLDAIAASLAEVDPEHAETYRENARLGKAELDELIADLQTRLDDAHDTRFIVFHDAYQYFEQRFNLSAAGAISLGDASDPSPARIDELRNTVTELGVDCVFSEPQFNPQLVENVFGPTGVNTSIVIDPLGAGLTPGESLYSRLLQQLADGVAECASDA